MSGLSVKSSADGIVDWSEQADHAYRESAADQPHDAVELVAVDAQCVHQSAARMREQAPPRLGQSAGGGRAVHVIHRCDLVDTEALHQVLAQYVALCAVQIF